ncbi:MAG TPA: methylmalonyl Co-A mutase-associated GTPase MeaB [Trueperaceae bacterium]
MDDLLQRLRAGEARALARAITLIESGDETGQRLLARLRPEGGRARVIGVTGAPGSGKSTLTDAMVGWARARDERVAVVAVDPSSPFSGGAILGDRIRMTRWHSDPGVFIRSMATRGHLGGLAAATLQVVAFLDAVGFGTILIETVGVGQSEVEIAEAADTTVLVLTPGQGDAVQAFKAGIMEIADIFVVNKADQPGANRLKREIRAMLAIARQNAHDVGGDERGGMERGGEHRGGEHRGGEHRGGEQHGDEHRGDGHRGDVWRIEVLETVASEGSGVEQVMEEVERHARYLRETGLLEQRRRRRAGFEVAAILHEELRRSLAGREDALVGEILAGKMTPAQAVARLLER